MTIIIGVAGGACAGKSDVCKMISEKLTADTDITVLRISLDSFYRGWTTEELEIIKEGRFNFDHPDAFDFELLSRVLGDISQHKATCFPSYDHLTRRRSKETVQVEPADVVLVEGTLLLYVKSIRDQLCVKIFADEDSDVRLSRRVVRDTEDYGRQLNDVLKEYVRFVKPSFEDFILPTKKTADIILPRAAKNVVAIDMVVQHIKNLRSGKHAASNGRVMPFSDMLFSSVPSLVRETPVAFQNIRK